MKIEELIEEGSLSKSLRVSRATLNEYRHQGLPYLKLGSRVFYVEADLMAWLSKNRQRVSDPLQRMPKIKKIPHKSDPE